MPTPPLRAPPVGPAVALLLVAACSSYPPGRLVTNPAGGRYGNALTVGCLDAVVTVQCDPETRPGAVIVQVDFGNRCAHRAAVDFRRLAVFEGPPESSPRMSAYDPRAEIVAGHVAAHVESHERIEFDRALGNPWPLAQLCVVASPMFGGAPTDAPICFGAPSPDACPSVLR